MTKRIKYTEMLGGTLLTDWFKVGPNYILRGQITRQHNGQFECLVLEFDSSLVKFKSESSITKAKRTLRQLLIEAGVKFDNEIRQTSP